MVKKILLLLIGVLAAYIVGSIAIRAIQVAKTPEWRMKLGHPKPLILPQDSDLPAEYQHTHNYIMVDILHAKQWSEHEVTKLLQFIDIPPIPDDSVSGSGAMYDETLALMSIRRSNAISAIASRFNSGAPIDEDQRDILIDRLTEGMYQNSSHRYFNSSVAWAIQSGLADTPGPIRDRLFLIYEHPTDFFGPHGEMAAANIKRQLTARGTFEIEGDN